VSTISRWTGFNVRAVLAKWTNIAAASYRCR
jgi:hypothetical protein